MPADAVRQIAQEDLVQGIADALQLISYCHPPDFVQALRRAHDAETHAPARDAMAQLLINSRLSYYGKRPLCQDTGVVQVFVRLGAALQWVRRDGQRLCSLQALVNEAVHRSEDTRLNSSHIQKSRMPSSA